jgi:ABC-type branched-subunit amino acid transport system substrate-binding protein
LNGVAPDVYAYTAYDALQVLVRTALLAGNTSTIDRMKALFVSEARTYSGASGNTELDTNGDRVVGNYDFWSVKLDTSGYAWKRTARYFSATGALIRQ